MSAKKTMPQKSTTENLDAGIWSDLVEIRETPRAYRRKTPLFSDSDEESANAKSSHELPLDKNTDLRTRLFDDDEESRDSGVGLGNEGEDDICLDLPARSFAIFTENTDLDPLPCPSFQPQSKKLSPLKDTIEEQFPGSREQNPSHKRVRPSQCEDSPGRQKRARTARFRRCKSHPSPIKSHTSDNLIPVPRVHHQLTSDSGSEDEGLTADNRRKLCLPTITGKHSDLNSITPETLSRVMNRKYSETIAEAIIIDCRYPYEYDGGHIQGAVNCYTKESLLELLMKKPTLPDEHGDKRLVLIFHCEFSSERGPKMSRFLRKMDRDANKECYPKLFYPEMYLLDEGYKNFFNSQKDQCTPPGYVPMHHEQFKEDMRKFRIKSKSWSGDKKSRSVFGL